VPLIYSQFVCYYAVMLQEVKHGQQKEAQRCQQYTTAAAEGSTTTTRVNDGGSVTTTAADGTETTAVAAANNDGSTTAAASDSSSVTVSSDGSTVTTTGADGSMTTVTHNADGSTTTDVTTVGSSTFEYQVGEDGAVVSAASVSGGAGGAGSGSGGDAADDGDDDDDGDGSGGSAAGTDAYDKALTARKSAFVGRLPASERELEEERVFEESLPEAEQQSAQESLEGAKSAPAAVVNADGSSTTVSADGLSTSIKYFQNDAMKAAAQSSALPVSKPAAAQQSGVPVVKDGALKANVGTMKRAVSSFGSSAVRYQVSVVEDDGKIKAIVPKGGGVMKQKLFGVVSEAKEVLKKSVIPSPKSSIHGKNKRAAKKRNQVHKVLFNEDEATLFDEEISRVATERWRTAAEGWFRACICATLVLGLVFMMASFAVAKSNASDEQLVQVRAKILWRERQ
jgi:hypothetical protein